jgi:transcriptional regulator with XRE-family HTH domain
VVSGHLGDRLARLRRLADLTQEELAEKGGVANQDAETPDLIAVGRAAHAMLAKAEEVASRLSHRPRRGRQESLCEGLWRTISASGG